MKSFSQTATEDRFVQDPYPFYEEARAQAKSLFYWNEYKVPCALSYSAVWAILRDRRFGREAPPGLAPEKPPHQKGFWDVEDHSLLELEPPRHTRLRGLILRAFTSRRIANLEPEIQHLANDLLDQVDPGDFDLISEFSQQLPVIIIARMLGIPEERCDDLLTWSHAMVGMYQANRTKEDEIAAARAAQAFSNFMKDYVDFRRDRPADDLITHLISAEEDGEKLSTPELISTCILLLNAGHEATVHTIGNGVYAMLRHGHGQTAVTPPQIDNTIEEILRFDPPLHMFQRWAYEDIEVGPHVIKKGSKVACLLAAANRDPGRWENPNLFDPNRVVQTNVSFGAGTHFCIGAPLARLEMKASLPILFNRLPNLRLAQDPQYAQTYHFHGLQDLRVAG
ncbi:MAG: cytochrome P450 [Marinosulfonomonas sp.]